MEGKPQPNDSVSGHQDLISKLIEVLKVVPPDMCEVDEQCIYKVPPTIREAHPQAYTPKIISIGPFHNPRGRGDANRDTNFLWSMEDLKLKFLKRFLNRTRLSVEDFTFKFKQLENRTRSCYAGHVIYNSNDFLMIIMTDACFIIEHFLRYSSSENDPEDWLLNHIEDDLILLENQLPFFVLQEIYEFAGLNRDIPSFVTITIDYFEELIKQLNNNNINTERVVSPKHFTDLLRIIFMPSSFDLEQQKQEDNTIDHVYTASQLSEAGLKFEVNKDSKCLFDFKFDDKKGVLKMPCFRVDDQTEMYLMNILAFEEYHFPDSAYIAQYLAILDFLINTEKDVSILVDSGIIINWMGDASSVAKMIYNLNNNVSMPDFNSDYHSLCLSLNGFYENPLNKYKAMFIHEYFNTPWKIASTIAAVLLLFLTLIQTICSVWSLAKQ